MKARVELRIEANESEEIPFRKIEEDIKKLEGSLFLDGSEEQGARARYIRVTRNYNSSEILYEVIDGQVEPKNGNFAVENQERYKSTFSQDPVKIDERR